MNIDAIAIGHNPPDDINVVVEVPLGGEPIKYELDQRSGALVVDRFLYTPTRYPGNYGFVPRTLSEDGDPIDVLVANTRPIVPGAVINVRPVGVLRMEDDGGGDEKIIAVPSARLTQRYQNVQTYTDLPEITWKRSSTSSFITRTLNPASGCDLQGGEMRTKLAN
ncbi:inorganic pyrophosphatase [Bradyrhizobium sp. USDA 4448]